MSENDVNIKLLIEAEDRSRAALDQARANTRSLVDQQKSLWKQVQEADNAEISGNKDKALSAERYFETRKKAAGMSEEINKGYRREESALAQLTKDHDAHAKGVEKANQQKIKSTDAVGSSLAHYVKHFASVAAVEEVIRRSIQEYATWERGMARIELQTGATAHQMEHLGHSIDGLARMSGISVEELQKNFMNFQAGIGEMGPEVTKAFGDVVKAAHAGGVSVDAMGRTAVAAIKTMQVPYGELKGMLDVIVDVIPASAMSAWDNVGPKILGIMRQLGSSGGDSVGRAAQAFAGLTAALGNAQTAGNVHLEMMKKGTDLSTIFGKTMTPQLIELEKSGASAAKTYEAFYQEMDRFGMFDDDPERAMFMQQRFGFSDEMVRGAQEYHKLYLKIEEEHAKAGGAKSWNEVERSVMRLAQGPKSAIDNLSGALSELLVSLGKFLGPSIPNTLTQYIDALNNDISRLDKAFEKFREKTGSRKPAEKDEHGNVIKPAEETPWEIDPVGWIAGIITGKSLAQQREEAKGVRGMALGKPGFGIDDAIWDFLTGGHDPAFERREEKRKELEERTGPQEPAPWGRTRAQPQPRQQPGASPAHRPPGGRPGAAVPDNEPRPGYAIGGEFEVQGGGGRDSQPVSFMATPGERVAVTTPTQESLQQQQDKADIAMREHFARFHGSAFTKTTSAAWWTDKARRGVGPGPGGAVPGGSEGGGAPTTTAPGAPGPDGKVAPSSATSTAPAGSVPATLPGSVASLGPEPGKFTPVPDLTTASGTSGDEGGGGGLATDRAKFARELANNPALREKIMRIAQNEQGGNPQGTQAVIESMMNRASYGGRTLAQEARWTGEGGYYAQGSMGRNMTAEQRATIEKSLDATLKGGNVSNYATDNASGDFARGRIASDMYRQKNYINGEYFVTPGLNPRGPGKGNYDKYNAWLAKMREGDAAAPSATKDSAVKTAKVTPNENAVLTPGAFDPNLTKLPAPEGMTGAEASTGQGAGVIKMMNKNAIRDKPLNAETRAYLEYASLKSGLEVHVGSGGQDAHGHKRTGSHRHDEGGAADYKLWDPAKNNGKGGYLDFSNPADKARMAGFVKDAAKAGATGQGAGRGYMGTQTIHTGGGSEATWGAEGKGGFVSRAAAEGRRERLSPEQLKVQLAELREQRATQLAGGTPTTGSTIKIATVKPSTAPVDASLLAINNKPAAAPTNVQTAQVAPGRVTVTDATPAPGRVTVTDADAPAPDAAPPGRQWGGEVRGGRPYTVGESGPETFTPAHPGSISPGGMDFSGMLDQYRQFADELTKPLRANIELPRAGPMRQRMSRRVEAQRERDVGRMTRHAAHSDIGMG